MDSWKQWVVQKIFQAATPPVNTTSTSPPPEWAIVPVDPYVSLIIQLMQQFKLVIPDGLHPTGAGAENHHHCS